MNITGGLKIYQINNFHTLLVVLFMILSELGWDPAVYGLSNVLFRRHQNGKDDEKERRVATTESVHLVVVGVGR